MPQVFVCPNCEKKLKTDQVVGQSIPCPYCKEVFKISEEDAYVPDPQREMLIKLAIHLFNVRNNLLVRFKNLLLLSGNTEKIKSSLLARDCGALVNDRG